MKLETNSVKKPDTLVWRATIEEKINNHIRDIDSMFSGISIKHGKVIHEYKNGKIVKVSTVITTVVDVEGCEDEDCEKGGKKSPMRGIRNMDTKVKLIKQMKANKAEEEPDYDNDDRRDDSD